MIAVLWVQAEGSERTRMIRRVREQKGEDIRTMTGQVEVVDGLG